MGDGGDKLDVMEVALVRKGQWWLKNRWWQLCSKSSK